MKREPNMPEAVNLGFWFRRKMRRVRDAEQGGSTLIHHTRSITFLQNLSQKSSSCPPDGKISAKPRIRCATVQFSPDAYFFSAPMR